MIMEIDFITSNKGKIAALKRSFLNAGRFDIKVNQVQADIVEPQLNNIADVSKYKAMEAFKIMTGVGKVTQAPEILTFDLLDLTSFNVNEI